MSSNQQKRYAPPERPTKRAGAVKNVSLDMRGHMDEGELMTGTPVIEEETTSDLALTNKMVNTETVIVNGVSCLPGQALQWSVGGGVAGQEYWTTVSVTTDAGETIKDRVYLKVISD